MTVLLTEDRGAVRVLTMNRPEKRNALNSELTQGLLDALRKADVDDAVGAIVLTGAGQGFAQVPIFPSSRICKPASLPRTAPSSRCSFISRSRASRSRW